MSLKSYGLPGRQQEGEHGIVHHAQGEHYQRKVLRVRVIVSGPDGNPKSFSVHRRNSKVQKQKSKYQIHVLVPVECKSELNSCFEFNFKYKTFEMFDI